MVSGTVDRNVLDVFGLLDLRLGSVSDEDGLSSPFDDDVLALGDLGKVDFDFSHGEDVS